MTITLKENPMTTDEPKRRPRKVLDIPTKRMTKRVEAPLTEDDYNRLIEFCRENGVRPGTFGREAILTALKKAERNRV